MTRGFSLYLDALRAIAALVVFFSHYAYARFSGGAFEWFRELNFGSDAVIIFFVMSGLLIAHTAERAHNGAHFAKARIARLYSVALPAIIITLALDAAGRIADPSLYVAPWDRAGSTLIEILRAASFTNEIWFANSRLGVNGPYWSLAYEAWYYVLFGFCVFTRGRLRIALVILTALLVGPRVLLLAPCWAAGVALHHVTIRNQLPGFIASRSLILTVAPILIYATMLATKGPLFLYALSIHIIGFPDPLILLGFSNEFLWNYILAALVFVHLIGIKGLADRLPTLPVVAARAIRWPAQRSFGLYLFHYPILSCIAAYLPFAPSPANNIALLILTLILSYALSEVTERRLPMWRRWTEHIWASIAWGYTKARRQRLA